MVFELYERAKKTREALKSLGIYDQVERLTRDLVGELEGYWESVAKPLGKLEGMSKYFLDKPDTFRLREMSGEFLEILLNTFISLRSDYSVASHEFMRTVFLGHFSMGLNFMSMICGINVSKLREIATKRIDKSQHISNFYNAVEQAIKGLYANSDTLDRVVSLIEEINYTMREADLDMPWDMRDVYSAVFRLSRIERDILLVLEELRDTLNNYFRSYVMEPY